MIRLYRLNSSTLPAFLPLVAAPLRSQAASLSPSLLAIGAVADQKPVGLVLATLRDGGTTADLLSLVVAEEVRRKGIGRRLLRAVQSSLHERGCRQLLIEYVSDGVERPESAAFLAASGIQLEPGIHIFSGPISGTAELAWLSTYSLPPEFSVMSWTTVTDAEREDLITGCGIWYPKDLSPYLDEAKIDLEWSLVLRLRGVIIGWLIMETFNDDTLLFKTLFVHQRYQRLGRGIALMTEIARRLQMPSKIQNGIFFVEAKNAPMVHFMYSRIDHSTVRKEILWRGRLEIMNTANH